MIINGDTLNALQRSFRTLAYEGIETVSPQWDKVGMEVPSAAGYNVYGWLQDIPGMKEWMGDREVQNLAASTYQIVNRDFELTVEVDRNTIEDDQVGVYAPMFRMLGNAVAYHPDELIFGLLKSAFDSSVPAYDGKAFCAANHRVNKANFSNYSNGQLTVARFEAAMATMQGLTNNAGRPLRLFMGTGDNSPLLLVGPSNFSLANQIVGLPYLIGGASNPNYLRARIQVVPEFVGAASNYWFLAETSRPVKPLILQRRKQPEFVRMDLANDENVFTRKKFRYGFDDRKNVGFAFWQLIYGGDGTVA